MRNYFDFAKCFVVSFDQIFECSNISTLIHSTADISNLLISSLNRSISWRNWIQPLPLFVDGQFIENIQILNILRIMNRENHSNMLTNRYSIHLDEIISVLSCHACCYLFTIRISSDFWSFSNCWFVWKFEFQNSHKIIHIINRLSICLNSLSFTKWHFGVSQTNYWWYFCMI
jgi:predicted membrane protein